ncbi:MAG TPA: CPBP family intramembrane metalloprotease [Pseudohongiella sp.]|nr:CPBP family intramembrane metalloprotease [Pseudohongiella sp.]HBX37321.1 CPBP family intramembrane metalloprotease [Pseudohongiella sp.]|tara:strand:+ start:276 stop:1043 length:768 start_codon:yes stop_codon:yes gene_type:complete
MSTESVIRTPHLRFGLYLWLAGMLGVVTLSIMVIPQQTADAVLPAPLWLLILISILQSGVLLAIAVWLGVRLAPQVGLKADAFRAVATGTSVVEALRPQWRMGLLGGLVGGVGLFLLAMYTPVALSEGGQAFSLPLVARVLYGGITEELLLRWGLMSLLVWLPWRILQGKTGEPRQAYVWFAILLSAVIFGIGHLPAAAAMLGELTGDVVLFIVGANSVFGALFGYLFWRYGLEAAIIAHGVSHIVSFLMMTLVM